MTSEQPVERAATLEDVRAEVLAPDRLNALVFGGFAGVALIIAIVGVAGVLAFSVSARTREFGVRMALGARIGDVVRLVMDQGLRSAVIGVVLGSAAALLLGRFITSLLFETSPRSPTAFAVAALVIVLVAAAASFVPAWRASRVDPVSALRGE